MLKNFLVSKENVNRNKGRQLVHQAADGPSINYRTDIMKFI